MFLTSTAQVLHPKSRSTRPTAGYLTESILAPPQPVNSILGDDPRSPMYTAPRHPNLRQRDAGSADEQNATNTAECRRR